MSGLHVEAFYDYVAAGGGVVLIILNALLHFFTKTRIFNDLVLRYYEVSIMLEH